MTDVVWEEPDEAFDKVIVKYQSAKEKRTVEVKKGVKSLMVEDLNSAGDYRFDLWSKDSDGRTSDVTTLFFHADGIMEAEVKNVTASSEWGGGVQAFNTMNKSGMTGNTVENYRHDNDGNATTMWHVRTGSLFRHRKGSHIGMPWMHSRHPSYISILQS